MDLDFSAKATPITLEGLKQSIVEKHPNGEAVGGISHVNLIEDVLEMFDRQGFKAKITDLFAANNQDKYRPGVTIDKYRAAQMEELGYEAVMIRRLFANIDLGIENYEGSVLKCVISYSQRGIQVAFGPEVMACRNLCILRAKDVFSTYALGRPSLREASFRQVDDMLLHIDNYITCVEQENVEMRQMIGTWDSREMTLTLYCKLLYTLMTMRVAKDTKDAALHKNVTYALNSSQINACHETALREMLFNRTMGRTPTAWEAYNWMNRLFKPEQMDTPSIVPQSLALTEAFMETFNEI